MCHVYYNILQQLFAHFKLVNLPFRDCRRVRCHRVTRFADCTLTYIRRVCVAGSKRPNPAATELEKWQFWAIGVIITSVLHIHPSKKLYDEVNNLWTRYPSVQNVCSWILIVEMLAYCVFDIRPVLSPLRSGLGVPVIATYNWLGALELQCSHGEVYINLTR